MNASTDNQLAILVAHAHLSVGEMLASVLGRETNYSLVTETNSGAEALRMFAIHAPEFVILDLEFADTTGVDLLHKMRAIRSSARFLFYTGNTQKRLILHALREQPEGFVHQSESLKTLRTAVDIITRESGSYFCRFSTNVLTESRLALSQDVLLTPRLESVLVLIANGLGSKQIADKLSLSPRTIDHYRKTLMRRLNANCIAALTLHAVNRGLVKFCLLMPPSLTQSLHFG